MQRYIIDTFHVIENFMNAHYSIYSFLVVGHVSFFDVYFGYKCEPILR